MNNIIKQAFDIVHPAKHFWTTRKEALLIEKAMEASLQLLEAVKSLKSEWAQGHGASIKTEKLINEALSKIEGISDKFCIICGYSIENDTDAICDQCAGKACA